jgi:hypothetical protein
MKDINIQVRHDSSPVVEASICLASKRKLRRQTRVPYAQRLPGAVLSPELLECLPSG